MKNLYRNIFLLHFVRGVPINYLSNDGHKHYDLVQLLSDTLDVVICGHKGCSYEDIIKEGN